MFILEKYKSLKTSIIIGLLVILLFVSSGLAVLAYPKPVKAAANPASLWAMKTVDIEAWLERILLGVWKAVFYPLLRRIVISLITRGDFGITWNELKTWFWKDLVFQIAEQTLNQFGLTLCFRLSANIKIALMRSIAPEYKPNCTYERSEIAQLMASCVKKGTKACWARVRRDFWGAWSLSVTTDSNQFGAWWSVKNAVYGEKGKRERQYELEILSNKGFLGARDCTRGKDLNHDGKIDPQTECPIVTPGTAIASMVAGEPKRLQEGTLKSEVVYDLMALFGMSIDLILTQLLGGMLESVEHWRRENYKEASEDYYKAVSGGGTEEKHIGENQTIPIPNK